MGSLIKRRLIVNDGQRERELLLVGTIVVGRDPSCDISEDSDSLLSRRHTEFVAASDSVTVRDLGSRNGTFLNGVRIGESVMRPGDVVHIGRLRVRYIETDAPLSAEPKPATPPPASIEDDEVTRVVRSASPPPAPPGQPDDDKTVITPRPAPVPRGVAAFEAKPDPDAEATVFTPRPAPAAKPSEGASTRQPASAAVAGGPASARQAPEAAARVSDSPRAAMSPEAASAGLAGFVSFQVFGVAIVTFALVVLAVMMGRDELSSADAGSGALLKWLGVPFVVALVASFVAGRMINRRIAEALAADNARSASTNYGSLAAGTGGPVPSKTKK